MKTASPLTFGEAVQLADCYIFTLNDGTTVYATGFDRPLVVPSPQSNLQITDKYHSASFTFQPMRIKRSALKWTAGVKPGELQITLGINANDILELALDWRAAAQRGLLDWATVAVWRAYGSGSGAFTLNNDGSATAGFAVPLFIGYIAAASPDRGQVVLQCYDPRIVLNMMLPRYVYGALCRWTLYNPGDGAHGCPVNRAQYAVPTTISAGSTRQVLVVPPFTGNAAAPGWFNKGYVVGSNSNANQRSSVRLYVPAVQSWVATALADGPVAFYPCADPPGSQILTDISGNNYNGAVIGAVEFGQTNLGTQVFAPSPYPLAAGMPPPYNTAAKFDNHLNGGNAYVKLPVPPPWTLPGLSAGGVTFEFVASFLQWDGIGTILPGLFDSGPAQNHALRFWTGPGTAQGTGGLGLLLTGEWAQTTFAPVNLPAAAHFTVVFRGTRTVEVYVNGLLANSVTTGGQNIMAWGNYTSYGGQDGGFTLGRVNPDDDTGALGRVMQGAYQYFGGYLQGFGIYGYPFSPAQAFAHAQAANTSYSTSSTATLHLVTPLPNQPAAGDGLIAYPGCDLTYRTCVQKFNAGLRFGGFPAIPDSETAV